jgi:hypothetical protein
MNPIKPHILSVAFALVVAAGCASTVTTETVTVRVKVVHHEKGPSWSYSELLYQVLEPNDLAGRYWVAATRKAAPPSLEGREFKLRMDSTMLERLMPGPELPEEYWSAPPSSKNPDFLTIAEPVP